MLNSKDLLIPKKGFSQTTELPPGNGPRPPLQASGHSPQADAGPAPRGAGGGSQQEWLRGVGLKDCVIHRAVRGVIPLKSEDKPSILTP